MANPFQPTLPGLGGPPPVNPAQTPFSMANPIGVALPSSGQPIAMGPVGGPRLPQFPQPASIPQGVRAPSMTVLQNQAAAFRPGSIPAGVQAPNMGSMYAPQNPFGDMRAPRVGSLNQAPFQAAPGGASSASSASGAVGSAGGASNWNPGQSSGAMHGPRTPTGVWARNMAQNFGVSAPQNFRGVLARGGAGAASYQAGNALQSMIGGPFGDALGAGGRAGAPAFMLGGPVGAAVATGVTLGTGIGLAANPDHSWANVGENLQRMTGSYDPGPLVGNKALRDAGVAPADLAHALTSEDPSTMIANLLAEGGAEDTITRSQVLARAESEGWSEQQTQAALKAHKVDEKAINLTGDALDAVEAADKESPYRDLLMSMVGEGYTDEEINLAAQVYAVDIEEQKAADEDVSEMEAARMARDTIDYNRQAAAQEEQMFDQLMAFQAAQAAYMQPVVGRMRQRGDDVAEIQLQGLQNMDPQMAELSARIIETNRQHSHRMADAYAGQIGLTAPHMMMANYQAQAQQMANTALSEQLMGGGMGQQQQSLTGAMGANDIDIVAALEQGLLGG